MPNNFKDIQRKIFIRTLKTHDLIYKKTDGILGHRILGQPCLLLTTIGSKTGKSRISCLAYFSDPDNPKNYLVVASNGGSPRHPSWYYNLKANPDIEIQIARKKFSGTATILKPEDANYPKLFDHCDKANKGRYKQYQRGTTRGIPVIVLSPKQ